MGIAGDKEVPKDEGGTVVLRWKTISITGLFASIPIILGLNASYKDYLADHVVTMVTPRIDIAQHTAEETQRKVEELTVKVDSLQISAAISAIAALNDELDRHERNPDDSISWRKERDRLRRQIEQAKEYRECLIDGHRNCELLRGW